MDRYRNRYRNRNKDLFAELPIDLIHIILSFLVTEKKLSSPNFKGKGIYTKQALQTIILSKRFLQAWSTFPHLYFTDVAFSDSLLCLPFKPNPFQQASISMERQRFANYVLQTLTRYQQHNIPLVSLRLTAQLEKQDDKIANILDQSICKAKEDRVKEVYLHMVHIRPSNLLQTIFALKQLVSLILYNCELVNKGAKDCDDLFINCLSLRTLKLNEVRINEDMLQKLINSCPLIEEIKLDSCQGIETIQIANLPSLKRLKVFTTKNQRVYVKSESLELMTYGYNSSLNIQSRNLKILKLLQCRITDKQFQNILAKFPVLEELTVQNCDELQKINISSQSLTFLSIILCMRLMEVKIDVPTLTTFEYYGTGVKSPLFFANEGCYGKIKSNITLDLVNLGKASSFLELREFLGTLKQSDNISLDISSMEVSFDRNIIGKLRDESNIPEFEQVSITVSSPSSTYLSLMEGLLRSFSPKIISLKHDSWEDKDFIMHLCKELLVQHDPNISTTNAFSCWGNYFKRAKFSDRDDDWRPLHSWKSLTDVLENLGDEYTLKLSYK